jgi:hypothetical protein
MRTVLKISTVLSWINLVIGAIFSVVGLFAGLATGNIPFLVGAFILSSIILHSYAALQLRRSIVNPSRPLSSQTPTGLRFIGAVVLFLGMFYFASGIAALQSNADTLKLLHSQSEQWAKLTLQDLHLGGLIGLFAGLSIALNVMLNFRLLRWYYFMKGMM